MNKSCAFLLLCIVILNFSCKKSGGSATDPDSDKGKNTNLLSSVTRHFDSGDEIETFTYDANNRITVRTIANTTYKYFYDSNNRLERMELYAEPRGLLLNFAYTYTATTVTETRTSADGSANGTYFFDVNASGKK